jgi:hypothetical protein
VITPEVIEAGALVIQKYSSEGDDPFFLAEQVFGVMLNRLVPQLSQWRK